MVYVALQVLLCHYWLFKNAFLYRKEPDEFEENLLRVNSTLDIEFPEKYLRLTIGDTTSTYNSLNSSFRFGGLSFGTNYKYPLKSKHVFFSELV